MTRSMAAFNLSEFVKFGGKGEGLTKPHASAHERQYPHEGIYESVYSHGWQFGGGPLLRKEKEVECVACEVNLGA